MQTPAAPSAVMAERAGMGEHAGEASRVASPVDASRAQGGAPSKQALAAATPIAACAAEAGMDDRSAGRAMAGNVDSGMPAMADAQVVQTNRGAVGQGATSVLRIYADAQGDSHLEELALTVALSKELPVSSASMSQLPASSVVDWHTAPARQFAVAVAGELEVEVSGGVRHAVHTGDLVFLEDTQGKGHITRLQGRVTNMFIRVPDSFDVTAWARGP